MQNSIIVFILCSTIIIIVNYLFNYLKSKPSYSCLHEVEVKDIKNKDGEVVYTLTTCNKCGHQTVRRYY